MALAASCSQPTTTTSKRRFNMQVLFDKVVHGRNLAKETRKESDKYCPHCNVIDSQAHIILSCQCPRLAQARQQGLDTWTEFLHTKTATNPLVQPLITALHHRAMSPHTPHVERYWLGTHDTSSWTSLTQDYVGTLSAQQLDILHATFKTATRILRTTADRIFLERRTKYWDDRKLASQTEWRKHHLQRSPETPLSSFKGFHRLIATNGKSTPHKLHHPQPQATPSSILTPSTQLSITSFFKHLSQPLNKDTKSIMPYVLVDNAFATH